MLKINLKKIINKENGSKSGNSLNHLVFKKKIIIIMQIKKERKKHT